MVASLLKSRLRKKNYNVKLTAIVLLDMCVKNLGRNFVKHLTENSYQKLIIKTIALIPKSELSERTLALVRYLKNNYKKEPKFTKTFQKLLNNGYAFHEDPEFGGGLNEKKISKKNTHSNNNTKHPMIKRYVVTSQQSLFDKKKKSEKRRNEMEKIEIEKKLKKIKVKLGLLKELLMSIHESENVSNDPLVGALIKKCKKHRDQLQKMVLSTQDEHLLGQILIMNDKLNNAIEWYTEMLDSDNKPEIKERNDYNNEKKQKISTKNEEFKKQNRNIYMDDLNIDDFTNRAMTIQTNNSKGNTYQNIQTTTQNTSSINELIDLGLDFLGTSSGNSKENSNIELSSNNKQSYNHDPNDNNPFRKKGNNYYRQDPNVSTANNNEHDTEQTIIPNQRISLLKPQRNIQKKTKPMIGLKKRNRDKNSPFNFDSLLEKEYQKDKFLEKNKPRMTHIEKMEQHLKRMQNIGNGMYQDDEDDDDFNEFFTTRRKKFSKYIIDKN
ncbi:tom1-like protein [Anaeramoeba flamelloides]|uniref:Tom1-like protein n=1 Tax=Anaeramoeba flamelloides TaxID=1746091 RepID=A0ABQ8ZC99_9EUKA|nr:tom1-like protein [Anaeramoeba flamelloides]